MADWTNVLDSAQDPDAPVTSEWGYAMRDNPIAIAEGAVGAPMVQSAWHAYDATAAGGSSTGGIIYSGASQTTIISPTFEDGFDYKFTGFGLNNAVGGSIQVNKGGSWSSIGAGPFTFFSITLINPTLLSRLKSITSYGGTGVISASVDRSAFFDISGVNISYSAIRLNASNPYTQGNVYLLKRPTHSMIGDF